MYNVPLFTAKVIMIDSLILYAYMYMYCTCACTSKGCVM